jgi:hypothetical protein
MDGVDEKAFANISSHILIRDKTTNTILLNKTVEKSLRNHQSQIIKDMENKQDA